MFFPSRARLASWRPVTQRRKNLEISAVPTLLARAAHVLPWCYYARAEGDLEACWNRILAVFYPHAFSHSQGQGLTNHHPCRQSLLATALPPQDEIAAAIAPLRGGWLCAAPLVPGRRRHHSVEGPINLGARRSIRTHQRRCRHQTLVAPAAPSTRTSRDFVHWRFADAGCRRAGQGSSWPASANLHSNGPALGLVAEWRSVPIFDSCAAAKRGYSITSSARASSDGGMLMSSALAVLTLITSSNVVGCSTGRSAGLAPLSILSTWLAARRFKSARFGPYAKRPPAVTASIHGYTAGSLCFAARSTTRLRSVKSIGLGNTMRASARSPAIVENAQSNSSGPFTAASRRCTPTVRAATSVSFTMLRIVCSPYAPGCQRAATPEIVGSASL